MSIRAPLSAGPVTSGELTLIELVQMNLYGMFFPPDLRLFDLEPATFSQLVLTGITGADLCAIRFAPSNAEHRA